MTTPWAGGFERINAYTYFAWIVVLAVVTLRRLYASPRRSRQAWWRTLGPSGRMPS